MSSSFAMLLIQSEFYFFYAFYIVTLLRFFRFRFVFNFFSSLFIFIYLCFCLNKTTINFPAKMGLIVIATPGHTDLLPKVVLNCISAARACNQIVFSNKAEIAIKIMHFGSYCKSAKLFVCISKAKFSRVFHNHFEVFINAKSILKK